MTENPTTQPENSDSIWKYLNKIGEFFEGLFSGNEWSENKKLFEIALDELPRMAQEVKRGETITQTIANVENLRKNVENPHNTMTT